MIKRGLDIVDQKIAVKMKSKTPREKWRDLRMWRNIMQRLQRDITTMTRVKYGLDPLSPD